MLCRQRSCSEKAVKASEQSDVAGGARPHESVSVSVPPVPALPLTSSWTVYKLRMKEGGVSFVLPFPSLPFHHPSFFLPSCPLPLLVLNDLAVRGHARARAAPVQTLKALVVAGSSNNKACPPSGTLMGNHCSGLYCVKVHYPTGAR